MSAKRKKNAPTAAERWTLTKRRIALGLYLVFLGGCLVGSQGTWWHVYAGDRPLGDPQTGPEFLRYSFVVEEPPAEATAVVRASRLGERYPTRREPNALRPAVVAALACAAAFFFASYNLVADADIQLPVFLATLALAGTGAFVLHAVGSDQAVIGELIAMEEEARLRRYMAAGPEAAAGSAPPAALPDVRLRFAWGLSLYLASALVLLILSTYMTFIAQRAAEKP